MREKLQHLSDRPKSLLVIGAIAFTTTFLAQLGGHSEVHKDIAGVALTLELGGYLSYYYPKSPS